MKFTTRGRITLLRDGVAISTHILAEEAYERAFAHAMANGPGKYTVRYPDREVDLSTLTRVVLEAAPAGLQAQAISASAINLTWTANPRATGYRVYRNGTLIGSPTANSYNDSGLTASTSYTYTVGTVAATGEGPQGAAVQGTTLAAPDTTAPTAPVITATPTGQSTVSVALTTPATDSQSGVASYDLEYKTAAASTYTAITGLTAGQFPYVIGSLLPATTYNTRARARDGVGNIGPYSTISNATTQPAVGGQSSGWTDIDALINSAPYASSRIVYVSTSGSDVSGQIYTPSSPQIGGVPTNPTGAIQPYATLAAAWNQIRNGFADVMLLRRGDTWAGAAGDLNLAKSGPSVSAKIIVAAYGPTSNARPVARRLYPESFATPGPSNLLLAHYTVDFVTSGLVGDQTLRARGTGTIRLEGLLFRGNTATNATVFLLAVSDDLEIFRCNWSGVSPYSTVDQRRDSFTFDENVMYKRPDYVSNIGFDHNNYFQFDTGNIVSRRNISAFSYGVGFRQRGLGVVEANLTLCSADGVRTPLGAASFDIGTNTYYGAGLPEDRGTYLTFRNNLALVGGLWALYDIKNAVIEGNIILPNTSGLGYFENTAEPGVLPTANVIMQDNIFYNTNFAPGPGHDGTITGPWLIRRNDFQRPDGGGLINAQSNDFTYEANNRFWSSSGTSAWFSGYTSDPANYLPSRGSNTQAVYPAPNRNMVTYMQSLGASPATVEQAVEWFINGVPGNPSLAGAMNNRLGAWDSRFTAVAAINHVRAGFGLGAIS